MTTSVARTADSADETAPDSPSPVTTTPVTTTPVTTTQQSADQTVAISGQELLTEVCRKLDSLNSLSCDLHETVSFSGMQVVAAGRYVQASGNRFRMDFRLFPATAATTAEAADSEAASGENPEAGDSQATAAEKTDVRGELVQVSDGTVLHTLFRNGDAVNVTRRNIRDIVAAAGDAAAYSSDAALRDLGLGGIRALIARIQTDMEFAPVRSQSDGGTELLVATGRWTKDARRRMFDLADDQEIIPVEHIPEYVRITIDAASRLPRRIQYLKRGGTDEERLVRPIVTLDFRSIELNQPIADDVFAFTPPEGVAEEDVTQRTIELVRQLGQPAAASPGGAAVPPNPGQP